MVLLEDVTLAQAARRAARPARCETYRRDAPVGGRRAACRRSRWCATCSERAMTFVEFVGALPAGPLRGPGAALPHRRLPGAAPDRARRGQDRGARRPRRVARRAGAPGRLEPARRVGGARPTGARTPSTDGRPPLDRGPDGRHPQRPRLPRAGAQRAVPPRGAGRAAAVGPARRAGPPRRAGTPSAGATRSSRTSPSTTTSAPAPTPAARSSSRSPRSRSAGSCARSSTTPRATATGRSAPRSTSPRRTRRAPRSSG